ncbi:hypothetical protein [uncultured Chitinophaga sp.]|uniref:hypothetical protein n=1 Tax=uncultured Chitinophaga sp. TaxID=339340 RepID=UPI0025EE89AA|nr:hypothetical protein [uncultured Chitinophaga sp.]
MYPWLLFAHSVCRWLVVASLLYAIFVALRGYTGRRSFSPSNDLVRHATATIAHVQLTIGFVLYFNSPFILYFRSHFREAIQQPGYLFFGVIHILLMTLSVVLITITSSVTKRTTTDQRKFLLMLIGFTIAFIIIFIAIPWPFSPLSHRPYLRTI